ncbi:hypothetical protein BV898_17072 [Hypsibius exemplaris]|uniref:Homeobox domain-containing protein n=1 Tax=Hypsibius exemplaris TaxID=2072580 RepID=A0A9X6RLS8_HYPEX|nr:hypothetical protein BV898_17072 [Hypsibius exemplaris]
MLESFLSLLFLILFATCEGTTPKRCISESYSGECEDDSACQNFCQKDKLSGGECGQFRSTTVCFCDGCNGNRTKKPVSVTTKSEKNPDGNGRGTSSVGEGRTLNETSSDKTADNKTRGRHARTIFSSSQREKLEAAFSSNQYPNRDDQEALAKDLSLPKKTIQVWFNNRRAKEREHNQNNTGMNLSSITPTNVSSTGVSRGCEMWTTPLNVNELLLDYLEHAAIKEYRVTSLNLICKLNMKLWDIFCLPVLYGNYFYASAENGARAKERFGNSAKPRSADQIHDDVTLVLSNFPEVRDTIKGFIRDGESLNLTIGGWPGQILKAFISHPKHFGDDNYLLAIRGEKETTPPLVRVMLSEFSAPKWFCYFYSNLTYSCKTNCTSNGYETKLMNLTTDPSWKYYDLECAKQVPLSFDKRWITGPKALFQGYLDTSRPSDITATCSFFDSKDFQCDGVTDCKEANNENRCGSATPWTGQYLGNPDEGFKLNGTIIKSGSSARGK